MVDDGSVTVNNMDLLVNDTNHGPSSMRLYQYPQFSALHEPSTTMVQQHLEFHLVVLPALV